MPLAENSDLIGPLTWLVINRALEQQVEWEKHGKTIPIALNMPPSMIRERNFPDQIAAKIDAYGVSGLALSIEITESGAMENATHILDILTRFRIKGIELAMDDFGTGYSSLVQLYRMPFSELKIDRSFVQDLESDQEAQTIVDVIINLAKRMHLKVCAEGIETKVQLDFLAHRQCGTGQGFYFSKPLPAADVLGFVNNRQPFYGDPSGSATLVSTPAKSNLQR